MMNEDDVNDNLDEGQRLASVFARAYDDLGPDPVSTNQSWARAREGTEWSEAAAAASLALFGQFVQEDMDRKRFHSYQLLNFISFCLVVSFSVLAEMGLLSAISRQGTPLHMQPTSLYDLWQSAAVRTFITPQWYAFALELGTAALQLLFVCWLVLPWPRADLCARRFYASRVALAWPCSWLCRLGWLFAQTYTVHWLALVLQFCSFLATATAWYRLVACLEPIGRGAGGDEMLARPHLAMLPRRDLDQLASEQARLSEAQALQAPPSQSPTTDDSEFTAASGSSKPRSVPRGSPSTNRRFVSPIVSLSSSPSFFANTAAASSPPVDEQFAQAPSPYLPARSRRRRQPANDKKPLLDGDDNGGDDDDVDNDEPLGFGSFNVAAPTPPDSLRQLRTVGPPPLNAHLLGRNFFYGLTSAAERTRFVFLYCCTVLPTSLAFGWSTVLLAANVASLAQIELSRGGREPTPPLSLLITLMAVVALVPLVTLAWKLDVPSAMAAAWGLLSVATRHDVPEPVWGVAYGLVGLLALAVIVAVSIGFWRAFDPALRVQYQLKKMIPDVPSPRSATSSGVIINAPTSSSTLYDSDID